MKIWLTGLTNYTQHTALKVCDNIAVGTAAAGGNGNDAACKGVCSALSAWTLTSSIPTNALAANALLNCFGY
jgi:hypothetical protein